MKNQIELHKLAATILEEIEMKDEAIVRCHQNGHHELAQKFENIKNSLIEDYRDMIMQITKFAVETF